MKCLVRSLIMLCVLLAQSYGSQEVKKKDAERSKNVILFVCEHGAARSVIASAYFNKIAKEQGLDYRAIFRGTDPETSLTSATGKGLQQDGFDIRQWRPRMVSDQDVSNANEIITFDCKVPGLNKSTKTVEEWNGVPPISQDYGVARTAIVEKVEKFISRLSDRGKTKQNNRR